MSLPSSQAESASLCSAFLTGLPVQHVAISTLGDPFELETVCASDPLAALLDELQLDYGEGPCWAARDTRSPVLIRDLRHSSPAARWPVLQAAIASHEIRAAYAFPLAVGSLDIGAVDLYSSTPDALSEREVAQAATLAREAAFEVLRRAVEQIHDPKDPSSRRIVHQATGMVIAQLNVPAEDALLVIRGHAYASGRSVRDVAADITARTLDFSD
ncbi:GAF and ANTAR domain-containing protein [Rathayibacter sp. YIM 133350]|uniref:GAF and ANTAR domain-containing protein n=1 Tax=Rathayibacter sp. YIM 133350 TaxID=3131992 RepID=UPI00307F781B